MLTRYSRLSSVAKMLGLAQRRTTSLLTDYRCVRDDAVLISHGRAVLSSEQQKIQKRIVQGAKNRQRNSDENNDPC